MVTGLDSFPVFGINCDLNRQDVNHIGTYFWSSLKIGQLLGLCRLFYETSMLGLLGYYKQEGNLTEEFFAVLYLTAFTDLTFYRLLRLFAQIHVDSLRDSCVGSGVQLGRKRLQSRHYTPLHCPRTGNLGDTTAQCARACPASCGTAARPTARQP